MLCGINKRLSATWERPLSVGRRLAGRLPWVLPALLLIGYAASSAAAPEAGPRIGFTPVHIGPTVAAGDAAPLVDIDTSNTVVPVYLGGGIQWDAHEWFDLPEEQWERLVERVVALHPGLIRCMVQAYWYCTGLDGDTPRYIWEQVDDQGNPRQDGEGFPIDSKGNRIDHNLKRLAKLIRILDVCEANGVQVLLGEWGPPANQGWVFPPANHLNGRELGLTIDDPRFARISAGFVRYLVDEKGYRCIHYFDLCNEVNLWCDKAQWMRGIRVFHREFERQGLAQKVTFVGPDAGYWRDLWYNTTLEELADQIGVYDFHWYIGDRDLRTKAAEDHMRLLRNFGAIPFPNRPLILGEMALRDGDTGDNQTRVGTVEYGTGMAEALAQCTRAGIAGTIAWSLDDAIHINGPIPPNYQPQADTRLKVWGFWNSLGSHFGKPEDEQPRPWFTAWTLLSRGFPAGCRIVHTSDPGIPGFTAMSGVVRTAGGDQLSVALINNRDTALDVVLRCVTAPERVSFRRFSYGSAPRRTADHGLPLADPPLLDQPLAAGLRIGLPAGGMVLLTSLASENAVPWIATDGRHRVDTLDGLHNLYAHSPRLGLNGFTRHPDKVTGSWEFETAPFAGDRTRVHRAEDGESAQVTYRLEEPLVDVRVGSYTHVDDGLRIQISADGKSWIDVPLRTLWTTPTTGKWRFDLLTPDQDLPADSHFVRLELPPVGDAMSTQIGYVELGASPLPTPQLTSLEELVITRAVGDMKPLPTTVRGRFDHDLPAQIPVAWEPIPEPDGHREGSFRVTGQWVGARLKIEAKIAMISRLNDTLDDWSRVHSHSPNLLLDRSNATLLADDTGRCIRTDVQTGELVYALLNLRTFRVKVGIFESRDVNGLLGVETSADGITWTPQPLRLTEHPNPQGKGWILTDVENANALPAGWHFLKVVLRSHPNSWILQVADVEVAQ